MDNSIFLKGKNKGINKELRGNVAFCYILVDEQAGRWSVADENAVVNSIRQTSSWLMQEAGKKNVTLNIRNFVFRSKSDVHVDLGMSNAWVKQVMQNTKYTSITELRNHFKNEKRFDDVAVIFLFRYEERSFASRQVALGEGEEYATVFYGEKCNTFIHEICHLYGACDLYYTDFVKEKVRRYLGGSIMCSNVLYVDDVTAYVIGWQKELTDMAKAFLQETMHITEAEWYAALSKNTESGHSSFTYSDGAVYKGEKIRGVPHGRGVLQYASGDKYQGEFRHGKPEGQGVLNYTNGDHYEGAFMNGTFEGKGVYYFHTGGKKKGIWKNGKYLRRF